jgi:ubiquitin-like-conjugating enzyme ATG10
VISPERQLQQLSGFGYMSRTVTLLTGQDDGDNSRLHLDSTNEVVEIDDDATVSHLPSTRLVSNQYIVYSATFQVPAFYFTIHDSSTWSLIAGSTRSEAQYFQDGSPLSLTDILKTSLFRRFALEGTDTTSFGVSLPASSFPLLSQGDHPTLGTPCWYFHPCETSASVGEVMKEVMQDDWTESQRQVRWMEAWFMVLGTAVNLKE